MFVVEAPGLEDMANITGANKLKTWRAADDGHKLFENASDGRAASSRTITLLPGRHEYYTDRHNVVDSGLENLESNFIAFPKKS